jgi:PKHD-type hydroxylase
MLVIDHVLTVEELAEISRSLQAAKFVDGKLTAGIYAQAVKNNQQLSDDTPLADSVQAIIRQALDHNALFQAAVRPKVIRSALVSRYEVGMEYGCHTDNAIMGETHPMRSDVSLTLFLSPPDTYDGGELSIDTSLGEQNFKLAAGSMIVYPSTALHQVKTVTKGVRLAAVTWVQSFVREASEREILFDLDTARRSIHAQHGRTVEFDLLSKTHANLLRKWVEL